MLTDIIVPTPGENRAFNTGISALLFSDQTSFSPADITGRTDEERRPIYRRPSGPPRTDQPRRFVEILFEPLDMLEIRLVPPKQVIQAQSPLAFCWKETRKRYKFWPWLHADELPSVVNALAGLNASAVTHWGQRDKATRKLVPAQSVENVPLNVYCSLNPRFTSGGKSGQDVLLARCLFADLEKISVADALQKVRDAGLPPPTLVVVSGHGVHLYWRLNTPIGDLSAWTALQKRLIVLLGSDPAVHDPARLTRLPGFTNVNGDPRPCAIHEADASRRYDLDELVACLPPTPPAPSPLPTRPSLSVSGAAPLPAPKRNGRSNLRRATAYADRFDPATDGQRNSKLFARTGNLVEKFGISHGEALALAERANDRAADPLDEDEVEGVVAKAIDYIDKKGVAKGTLVDAPVRVEAYREPQGEIVPLEVWRENMAQARIDSLKVPGIYLDSSTTGAGKSTADQRAMTEAKTSLTVLPTHSACTELVKELRANGIQAAAHPPLDATTCALFGTEKRPGPAQKAQKAGLIVGLSVCPTCPHSKTCDYQERRDEARNAAHTVATHARASNSEFGPAKDRAVVFIHEDPRTLFRPMVKLVRRSTKPDVPQVSHLREIVQLAGQAEDIARSWQDHRLIRFARQLHRAADALADHLESDELIGPFSRASEAGQSTKDLPTVRELAVPQPPADEATTGERPSIEDVTGWASPVGCSTGGLRHKNADFLLHEAMRKSGTEPNGPALKLAVAYACGELTSLCAVIDEVFVGRDDKQFHKALVGVWTVQPPENCVVWLENAHADAKHISAILGKPVTDRTPRGRLAFQVPPVQHADQDVTQQTSGKVVRGLLRKVMSLHPNARKVGVITHQRHKKEIERLDRLWAGRIARVEHFHSGKDRASNAWLDCDLIVILGTPRVPPLAVRDGLIRLGRIKDASASGNFGTIFWEGRTVSGKAAQTQGVGYGHPAWAEMQHVLVREAMLQAVGRGRGVTDRGVPVVVVSSEPLGLTLADSPLVPVSDPEADILRLVAELSEQNAKDTTLGKSSVTTADVAGLTRKSERQVCKLLSSLHSHGLLRRKGARCGWLLV